MLDDAARTAQQAADALGVGVGQIAKSIIFRRKADDAAVLVITSGDRRVDEKKVEAHGGQDRSCRCRLCREGSHRLFDRRRLARRRMPRPPVTLIDRDLLRFDVKSGPPPGTRMACFRCTRRPGALTGAPVADVDASRCCP
jgi:hypothetical protein